MKRTILQVPVTPELQSSAKRAAAKQGFSSLQDVVRLFLQQFSAGKMTVRLESFDEERLSPRAARRYAKIAAEIKSGKGIIKTDGTLEDFFRKLNS